MNGELPRISFSWTSDFRGLEMGGGGNGGAADHPIPVRTFRVLPAETPALVRANSVLLVVVKGLMSRSWPNVSVNFGRRADVRSESGSPPKAGWFWQGLCRACDDSPYA